MADENDNITECDPAEEVVETESTETEVVEAADAAEEAVAEAAGEAAEADEENVAADDESVAESAAEPEPDVEDEPAEAEAAADEEPAEETAVAKRPKRSVQAKATAAEDTSAPKAKKPVKVGGAPSIKLPIFIVAVVVAVAVGVLAGHFLLGGSTISVSGKTTVTEDQLDSTIATYTYNGKTVNITAREVITLNSTLANAVSDDGTYSLPAADDILSFARNAVVVAAADARGITVTDDEVDSYAESMCGSSDYATIASNYSIDEDVAKNTITSSCKMAKLRDEVVTTTLPTAPTAPTSPDDDATDTPTAEYASYIIELAGDEWDSENNTWARTDGDYYSALSSYEITNDSATYAAAQAAYYVAYSNYSTAYSSYSSEWSTYVNSVLSNATIQLGSLAV